MMFIGWRKGRGADRGLSVCGNASWVESTVGRLPMALPLKTPRCARQST